MLVSRQSQVCSFDSKRGVIRNHVGRGVVRLTECGADNSVVRLIRIKPVLVEKVLLNAIDLDVNSCIVRRFITFWMNPNWMSE